MCMSTHEMTSARLEELAETAEKLAEQPGADQKWWAFRAEEIRKILKERADDGTYATAGR